MKNSKLYSSVWESIEEGRLKEAVQLTEELRSSKDAETATRIEGAVKERFMGWQLERVAGSLFDAVHL